MYDLNSFSLLAWSYHHRCTEPRVYDDISIGNGRTKFYDLAENIGVDIMIDYHNMVDDVSSRGMQLIAMTSVSPNDINNPKGDIHWGKPTVDGGEAYGNINQLKWLENNFHDDVLGYCLNDSCTPCPENNILASWLKENAPNKLRYVSYGKPAKQNGILYPITSFMNYAFDKPEKTNIERQLNFIHVMSEGKKLQLKNKCELYFPVILVYGRNRQITVEDITFSIETAAEHGANGVVLYPFGQWYNTLCPDKQEYLGDAIKAVTKRVKRRYKKILVKKKENYADCSIMK